MVNWRGLASGLGVAILLGALVALIVIVVLSLISRNSPCKNSSTCPIGQTCDGRLQRCVSLPGSRCSNNNGCSVYAPLCNPQGSYCTNFPTHARGTAGNPPNTGSGSCDVGLIYNSAVNLCQQTSIGAQCTIDAECNQGVCDARTKTCQYATTQCTTDTNLNPQQCAPPYECDHSSLICTLNGATPGSDGTPCNSSADCAKGSSCITGPPGAGFSGVCRSGQLTWLMLTTDAASCITPLSGMGTNYCRYDIAHFMICSGLADCQYPYASCDPRSSLCKPAAGTSDPITTASLIYHPVGINLTGGVVNGGFYTASYATTPPGFDNTTGGKLLEPYTGFLTPGMQFQDQPDFLGLPLVSFSRDTSFCVASLANATDPPSAPQTGYYNAIFEDPNPVLVMTAIVPDASAPGKSQICIAFYSESYPIPGYDTRTFLKPLGGLTFNFNSAAATLWNPAAVAAVIPNLNPMPMFMPNPIITPWIEITPIGNVNPPQACMTHTLFYAEGRYRLGFFYTRMGLMSTTADTSSIVLTPMQDLNVLTPALLLVTSWDAITTQITGSDKILTTVLLYGLSSLSGSTYQLYLAQIVFKLVPPYLIPAMLTPGFADGIPVSHATIPRDIATGEAQCRLSRAIQQSVEPLLILTIFSEVPGALQISPFAINADNASLVLDSSPCTRAYQMGGVASLMYVTPVTGAYNYGGFVIWCSTAETRSAFVLVQVDAFCNNKVFNFGLLFTAIYWRRLPGDPDDYYLYPVGGASLPYFLATDRPLQFNGSLP